MSSPQDTFVFDLLVRCAAIQRTISVVIPDGNTLEAKFAYPRWFESLGNNTMPGFLNRAVRQQSTPSGRPIRKDVYIVTMRLVIGSIGAGYQGEYEDYGNQLYVATINAFDAQQRLAAPFDPPNNEPLRYVEAARILSGDNGIEGKIYGDNPQTVYMVIDLPLEVTANFQVFRQS